MLEEKIDHIKALEIDRNRRKCAFGYKCKLECETNECKTWKYGQIKLAIRYNYNYKTK